MRRIALGLGAALLLALTAGWPASGEEPLKSGPQPGQSLPGSFEPYNVTGEHAGEPYCLVCAAGLQPQVMIFARTLTDPLIKLLKRADEVTGQHEKEGLGSFCVFLTEADGMDQKLRDAAEKHGLTRCVLAIDAPEGPDGYGLRKEADVTVVLYTKHVVEANHVFKAGALDDAAIDRIMADLPKILPAP